MSDRATPSRYALRVLVAAAEILEHDHREPCITESPRDRPSQLPEVTHLAGQEHRARRRPTGERVRINSADGGRGVHKKRHVINDGGRAGAARSSSSGVESAGLERPLSWVRSRRASTQIIGFGV
jgi:hypothetical protein